MFVDVGLRRIGIMLLAMLLSTASSFAGDPGLARKVGEPRSGGDCDEMVFYFQYDPAISIPDDGVDPFHPENSVGVIIPFTLSDGISDALGRTIAHPELAAVCDVDLKLDVYHTNADELIIELGQDNDIDTDLDLLLIQNSGGAANGFDIWLDDEAPQSITQAYAPSSQRITGTWSPSNNHLYQFDGRMAGGNWIFQAFDGVPQAEGEVRGWGLRIMAGDGTDEDQDNCPGVYNRDQADWNNDGEGDACQDWDGDGVRDDLDNCPAIWNPDQENLAGDTDGDGLADCIDVCPLRRPGDVSGDGVVSASDVAPLVSVLLDPSSASADELCAADVDGSGEPDGLDIEPFVIVLLGA